MKQKQLEEITKLRAKLSILGSGKAPSLERHLIRALCSGEVLKMKPAVAISETARNKIIQGQYNSDRTLNFSDVFAPTSSYDSELKLWNAYEAKRKSALARFEKAAEKIMVAAMDSESDAEGTIDQLHAAAEQAGLNSLEAPVFGKIE